jgi:hypothetical protein
MLLELRFKAREQSESIRCGPGETGYDFAVVQPPELARAAFQNLVAHGDLSVTGENHFAVTPNAQDRRRTDFLAHLNKPEFRIWAVPIGGPDRIGNIISAQQCTRTTPLGNHESLRFSGLATNLYLHGQHQK